MSKGTSQFFVQYDLSEARKLAPEREPVSHQSQALRKLRAWYDTECQGGLLVLPTGGGKTFTAFRFLCEAPLSDGYKVLWLAHTHHLLEQAHNSIQHSVSRITEPREALHVRVVSGTPGHFPVASIKKTDDIVIGTVQTIIKAVENNHKSLQSFLKSTDGKIFVVFDEAHHSPAPSYRRLIRHIQNRFQGSNLLGLTATPTYTDKSKRGWLKKLYDCGIVYQVSAQKLIAAGILAKPVYEEPSTHFQPEIDAREYEKWLSTNQDVPEKIIGQLAENKERNSFIVQTYLQSRKRYGKTLIFADRWYQCEYLREALEKRGVRAGVVYSKLDADAGTPELRNRRHRDENDKALQAFRNGKLDVLINVRMLTEGTDVPDVQSVFLTRQTTSQILMTQMVGRALRGPKFGGTDKAYIVAFIDDWQRLIKWADYGQISGGVSDAKAEYGKRPPLQLLSIELVRRLARQMDGGINIESGPYLSRMPVGWYRVEYQNQLQGTDDIEPVQQLIMVFDDEYEDYRKFINDIGKQDLSQYESEGLQIAEMVVDIGKWQKAYFTKLDGHYGRDHADSVFSIVRHMAQTGESPQFFPFEERSQHDLDKLAKVVVKKDLGPNSVDDMLRHEYNRKDRYWRVLYYLYDLFKSQMDACVNRILNAKRHGAVAQQHKPVVTMPERIPDREPSKEIKLQVKRRDEYTCQCCRELERRRLQIDHVVPFYEGGSNLLDNLQTLCRTCNGLKRNTYVNFRDHETDLTQPPPELPAIPLPMGKKAGDWEGWYMYLHRVVNFYYRCGAVGEVYLAARGSRFYDWEVELNAGNNPAWLKPHVKGLLETIRNTKSAAGYGVPRSLAITAPGRKAVRVRFRK